MKKTETESKLTDKMWLRYAERVVSRFSPNRKRLTGNLLLTWVNSKDLYIRSLARKILVSFPPKTKKGAR